jgi:hypothetical protein
MAWRNWSSKTVLLAINVFASVAIFFEGYDQGVMVVETDM